MGRFFGDAPRDLEFLGRKRRFVAVPRDLEPELAVVTHEHEEAAIRRRDSNHRVHDADQEFVQVQRARYGAAGLEEVLKAVEVVRGADAGRRLRLDQELALPLREATAQAFERIVLGEIGGSGRLVLMEGFGVLRHRVLASQSPAGWPRQLRPSTG
jgi:hypothetical protein